MNGVKKTAMKQSEPAQLPEVSDETLQRFIGYRIRRASNVMQGELPVALKPFGLRMITFTALVLIVDNPGLSQSRLAAAMDVERPNLVVIIDELENRDLINRDRVPTDRRAYALTPTLAGRRLCEKAVAAVEANETRILKDFDPELLAMAGEVMTRILNEHKGG